jgi:hypothetical protein
MVAVNQLLIEAVTPAVRKALVRERARAMRGRADEAIRALERDIELVGPARVRDVVALGILRAELLHLDRRDADALRWYRERVLPLKGQLGAEEQFVVEQNLADLEMHVWSPDATATFYNLVDRRRLAGFDWFDAGDVLAAQEAAAAGKHYETLPILWRQAVRAYLQGCWLSSRWAARRLAAESLQLGSLAEAAFYVVTAPVKELVDPVAEALLRRGDAKLVGDVVNRVCGAANLRRHFSIACELLYGLGDAIADADLSRVAGWLLPRCAESPDGALGESALNMAWKALESIAHRLPAELAQRAVETAFAHPVWTTRLDKPNALIVEREQMVKTVNQLVGALPPGELDWAARGTLPLAVERRQVHDYADVINLLCHTARRGGPAVKDFLAAALFPPGKQLDRLLVQVGSLFKDERPPAERVATLTDRVAGEIRLQVRVVGSGEEPAPVPELVMSHCQPIGDRKRIVSLVGGVGLHTVARHRQLLPPEVLARLVAAILTMAGERENFLADRAGLLRGLTEFADSVDERLRREVCLAVEPIARGMIEEPSGQPTAAEVEDPLNPNKVRLGQVGQLRAIALVTLAEFARFDHALTQLLGPVLEEAFYDRDPEVRRGAYAAAARLPEVTEPVLLAVLLGANDPDPNVSAAALFAMAKQSTWELTRSHWRVLLHGLRRAAQSPAEKVRRNAAAVASAWADRAPTKVFKASLQATQALSREDMCASVRELATRPPGGSDVV